MKCKYIKEWECYMTDNPLLPECEFCLKIRLTYVSQYKPFAEDYAKNIGELNEYRRREKELPK